MATRYGYKVYRWLLERNWIEDAIHDPECVGDPGVIDRVTGYCMDVYTAAALQRERTGEYPDCLRE